MTAPRRSRHSLSLLLAIGFFGLMVSEVPSLHAQQEQTIPRIMQQDSTLNNLSEPAGYGTVPLGTLGRVSTAGEGSRTILMIPGLGFSGSVFDPLIQHLGAEYTIWLVTLPGFGGTQAPQVPPDGTSFGEQTWTNGSVSAIADLLEAERLSELTVVGHWLGGTQIALRLAELRPDLVERVILLSGSANLHRPWPGAPEPLPLQQRIDGVDQYLAPLWFRTVTRETWDDNNFLPGDYAMQPVLGLRLWREAARTPLHVWIRYLCEFYAQDSVDLLTGLSVPVLVLLPGLEGLWHDPENNYLARYTRESWANISARHLTIRTLANTRIVLWADAPEAVVDAMEAHLESIGRDRPEARMHN